MTEDVLVWNGRVSEPAPAKRREPEVPEPPSPPGEQPPNGVDASQPMLETSKG